MNPLEYVKSHPKESAGVIGGSFALGLYFFHKKATASGTPDTTLSTVGDGESGGYSTSSNVGNPATNSGTGIGQYTGTPYQWSTSPLGQALASQQSTLTSISNSQPVGGFLDSHGVFQTGKPKPGDKLDVAITPYHCPSGSFLTLGKDGKNLVCRTDQGKENPVQKRTNLKAVDPSWMSKLGLS